MTFGCQSLVLFFRVFLLWSMSAVECVLGSTASMYTRRTLSTQFPHPEFRVCVFAVERVVGSTASMYVRRTLSTQFPHPESCLCVFAVERVMGITTSMYVRRTLPLQQAITAMKQKNTRAAVVVDDNFKVRNVSGCSGMHIDVHHALVSAPGGFDQHCKRSCFERCVLEHKCFLTPFTSRKPADDEWRHKRQTLM